MRPRLLPTPCLLSVPLSRISRRCEFVTDRCGSMRDDYSVDVPADEGPEQCEGDPAWANTPNAIVSHKCQGGLDPCDQYAGAGLEPRGR